MLIEDNGQEVRPEIYNNIGSLNIRRGDLEGAKKYLNMALEKVRSDIENQQGKNTSKLNFTNTIILGDIGYLKNIRNTIRFNIARLSEDMYSYDKGTIFSF